MSQIPECDFLPRTETEALTLYLAFTSFLSLMILKTKLAWTPRRGLREWLGW